MSVGIQVFNDQGAFQIDSITKSYILVRTIICTTTGLVGDRTVTSQGSVTVNSGEILAISSDKPCCVYSTTGSTVYLRVKGDVGSTVTCYVFATITNSTSLYGLQVFSDAGELVFCSTKKPLRLVGITSDNGTFNYTAGRLYASIMINQYYNIQSDRVFLGGTTVRDTIITYRGMIKTQTGGVIITTENEYWNIQQYTAPTPPGLPPNTTSVSKSINAIIDVTNY